ncbi:bifunctional DNA primase/polymerase [Bifidobacterium amazonense]|uniref:Bifunctional DNA primase/polymerase n=1 Tax=Bifidobacterium amazonense TaxID=2809027 RepID=A0ABS9VUP7_9BIFI|nr:bifunctional DNA primase/polymerase [Bifidobacterium amazonense]MCH9275651.1 bifunctional DNA primase/polymerase [Bifidobacterium amazonense]
MDAPFRHQCSIIPDGPSNVQTVLMGMRVSPDPWKHTFYDRVGRSIEVPRNEMNKSKPYFDDGYAKALWDFRNDSMLLGEDGQTLYVRDVDLTGANRLLDSWHAIGSLEDEYHVTGRTQVYLPWNVQLRVECAKLAKRVRHGVKFRNMAFYRIDGRVQRISPGDPLFDNPFEVFMDVDYTDELVAKAGEFLRFVTADAHSAENLGRMFATPLLEPYKHLFYVLYGGGGNGKGILLDTLHRSLPALSAAVTSKTLLGGRNGNGGFATDQEMLKLIGALWAYDEDADTITLEQATLLKKIGTGDTMVARRVQENAVSFKNKATFIIASNNPVIMSMTEALERRRVFVRMKDGRAEGEFADLLRFRDEHGIAPFLMASCRLWEARGDKPWTDVVIGSADDLTEAQQWIVDCIVANGYAVSRDNPFRETEAGHRNTAMKLGLKSKPKRINGEVVRVLVVRNEHVFSVYRDSAARDLAEAVEAEAKPVPPLPPPIEGAAVATPDDCGYPVTFGSVTDEKRSYDWAKNRTLPEGKQPPANVAAYAVVPAAGMAIIDLDVAKDPATGEVLKDAPTGWDVFNREIGEYGSPDFPKTYLVGTPTGRRNGLPSAHAYYMIPPELRGRLKNAVHEKGIPVDIRCEGKGYVVGAGSRIPDGDYLLLDLPDGQPPVMPQKMEQWLIAHNYVTNVEGQATSPVSASATRIPPLSEVMRQPIAVVSASNGRPDMTPIPAGSRNNDLHAWAYGRLLNHPENAEAIQRDLLDRGRASGLKDTELTTIWNSIRRQLGGG